MRSGFWRNCRICFRWCRFTTWFLVLVLLGAVLWLNRIGLPDFLKERLIKNLREQGIELEFTRLRLHFTRGIVAENVRIGDAQISRGPSLSLEQVQLLLDFPALLHRQLQIDGLVLREGRFVWPLTPTNTLALEKIQTDLRFQSTGMWSLDHFQAYFDGVRFDLSGDVAHAAQIRDWAIFSSQMPDVHADWRPQLENFLDTLDRIHLQGGQPQLNLYLNGDARDLRSFTIRLNARVPSAQTPWGSASNLQLAATLDLSHNAPAQFDNPQTWWTNTLPAIRLNGELSFTNGVAFGTFLDSAQTHFSYSDLTWRLTNLSVAQAKTRLEISGDKNDATGDYYCCVRGSLDPEAVRPFITASNAERSLDRFTFTEPVILDVDLRGRGRDFNSISASGFVALTNFSFQKQSTVDSLQTHFSYTNLNWQLTGLNVAQGKTRLAINADENGATKNYHCHIRGTFDPETIRPFITARDAERGLDRFTFTEPLALDVDLRGRGTDLKSIGANGYVALTNFAIHEQSADSVSGKFFYTNMIVEFFHPQLWRKNGTETMVADKITLDFKNKVIDFTNGFSTAEPLAVARAIGPKTGKIMEPYEFLSPPTVLVHGRSTIRDINSPRDMDDADLYFTIIKGAPFQWLKIRTPDIQGTIHWFKQTLTLTNVTGAFYTGNGNGFASFDFASSHPGADYQFSVAVTNVNLHLLAVDLSSPTNKLDGTLAGRLIVTDASTEDWRSWNGYGHASLRDGLIWDVPVFGILSPALNALAPGLGNSRATDATARFGITNGVIFTDSLDIRTMMARLQYVGTVDLKQNVNARVSAQLLRDTPVIGSAVSFILTPFTVLFEYQVSGTLGNPKSKPVYVPKIFLLPLHPIRTLQEMLPGD